MAKKYGTQKIDNGMRATKRDKLQRGHSDTKVTSRTQTSAAGTQGSPVGRPTPRPSRSTK